jgi:hypothetical protein
MNPGILWPSNHSRFGGERRTHQYASEVEISNLLLGNLIYRLNLSNNHLSAAYMPYHLKERKIFCALPFVWADWMNISS